MELSSHGKEKVADYANPAQQQSNSENSEFEVSSKIQQSSGNSFNIATVNICTNNQSISPYCQQNALKYKPPENQWAVALVSESSSGQIKMFLKRN